MFLALLRQLVDSTLKNRRRIPSRAFRFLALAIIVGVLTACGVSSRAPFAHGELSPTPIGSTATGTPRPAMLAPTAGAGVSPTAANAASPTPFPSPTSVATETIPPTPVP